MKTQRSKQAWKKWRRLVSEQAKSGQNKDWLEGRRELIEENKRTPVVANSLIALNVLVFLASPIVFARQYPAQLDVLGTNLGPLTLTGQWWRLITCSFVHIYLLHLIANIVVLYLAGKVLERRVGPVAVLILYLGCGIAAGLTALVANPVGGSYGASGGVAGIVAAVWILWLDDLRRQSFRNTWKTIAIVSIPAYIAAIDITQHSGAIHFVPFVMGGLVMYALICFGKRTMQKGAVTAAFAAVLNGWAALLSWAFVRPHHDLVPSNLHDGKIYVTTNSDKTDTVTRGTEDTKTEAAKDAKGNVISWTTTLRKTVTTVHVNYDGSVSSATSTSADNSRTVDATGETMSSSETTSVAGVAFSSPEVVHMQRKAKGLF